MVLLLKKSCDTICVRVALKESHGKEKEGSAPNYRIEVFRVRRRELRYNKK